MPIHQGYTTKDGKRRGYFQWGSSGKKYYYTPGSEASREKARKKAEQQAQAAHASGYEG